MKRTLAPISQDDKHNAAAKAEWQKMRSAPPADPHDTSTITTNQQASVTTRQIVLDGQL